MISPQSVPTIELSDIGVRYRIPTERIGSFKEYVLRRMATATEYRELWALRDLTLKIWSGELLGIVGRNGAGKSTLLKVVSRVLHPTTGRVIVRGRLAPLLELGAGFHPDMTGRENVILNATILGHPRALVEESLEGITEFAELQEFINLPIRTYSTGMTARLGFAVATQFRPDILLMDEVLAVGDVGFQEKCLGRIAGFRAAGTTIVLVSHSLETLAEHCDRVAWLERGRVSAIGPPGEVLPRYARAMEPGRISQPEPVD